MKIIAAHVNVADDGHSGVIHSNEYVNDHESGRVQVSEIVVVDVQIAHCRHMRATPGIEHTIDKDTIRGIFSMVLADGGIAFDTYGGIIPSHHLGQHLSHGIACPHHLVVDDSDVPDELSGAVFLRAHIGFDVDEVQR